MAQFMEKGFDFIQDGYELLLVIHVPLALDPKAGAEAIKAILTGGSKPFMAKQTVSGEGKPLACCLYGLLGLNNNCWSAGPLKKVPSGIVLCSTWGSCRPRSSSSS